MRQVVTVLATLDYAQAGDRVFHVSLENGQEARCVLVEGDPGALAALRGQRVVIQGMAVFYPTRRLDRIEVDRFFPGEGEPETYARIPNPLSSSPLPVEAPTPRPWGLEGIIGKWPGEEADEEIEAQLREIS
jgi:hypothetical protein